eukprot:m.999449 g.999449  ORF g.999449 m.999449 type:complete len:162 (+) comp24026_c0_seq43:843-1328(+)
MKAVVRRPTVLPPLLGTTFECPVLGFSRACAARISTKCRHQVSTVFTDGRTHVVCMLPPHQSNGVLRAVDVEGMALRHPGERVVCIDHHAALVCEGGGVYSVFRLPAAQGSVRSDGSFAADRSGEPGVWIKDVVHGAGDRDGQSRVSAPLHVIGALVGHRH